MPTDTLTAFHTGNGQEGSPIKTGGFRRLPGGGRDESQKALIVALRRHGRGDVRDVAQSSSRPQAGGKAQDAPPFHRGGVGRPENSRARIALVGAEEQAERRLSAMAPLLGAGAGDLGSSVPFRQISGRLLPGLRLEAGPTNAEAFACRAGPPGLAEGDNDPQRPPH